jgi:phosphatidylglycerophosphate synthase
VIVAKQVADFLTLARAMLVIPLVWLGFAYGSNGIPAAVLLLLCSWTSDAIDGPIARRSRIKTNTWLGDHDLQVDMAVSGGLLVYMMASGLVSWWLGAAYTLVWALVLWRWGLYFSLGMLFQAPIYAGFIWMAVLRPPSFGLLLVAWIIIIVLVTWPRFPREVVPEFLAGLSVIGLEVGEKEE